jgi:hypothetical protein
MMEPSALLGDIQFLLNGLTILISFVAVVYWVKLFRRIYISGRHDEGWLWIFASVLMVLLLNLSTLFLVLGSSRLPLGVGRVLAVDVGALSFVNTFSRIVMAVSLAIGAHMLYESMRARGDVKFVFTPVTPVAEEASESEPKYELEPGCSYIVEEGPPGGDVRGYYIKSDRRTVSAMDLFVDLVTHGVLGFVATRDYPPKLREQYGLPNTPMVWLTRERGYADSIYPADLIELSHVVKAFISRSEDTVVLLQGVEYLILHNSFDDVLKMIQGLDDVVVQHKARLIVPVDPSALTEQHYHLLSRELKDFNHQ